MRSFTPNIETLLIHLSELVFTPSTTMFTPTQWGRVPALGCDVCFLTGGIYYWRAGNLLATWQPAVNLSTPCSVPPPVGVTRNAARQRGL
eukprot:5750520-Prymnesium_polylepis.1